MLRVYGAEERQEEEGLYGSTIETPQQRVGWKAVRGLWDGSKKDDGKVGCGILIGQRSMDHYFATAAEVAEASVLNEDVDLISTEQMTELTTFKSIARIVRDARTKIDERWSTFRVQRCGMFSSEHTLEALVVCSDFWEDRFSRPKLSEKKSARVDDTAPRERRQQERVAGQEAGKKTIDSGKEVTRKFKTFKRGGNRTRERNETTQVITGGCHFPDLRCRRRFAP